MNLLRPFVCAALCGVAAFAQAQSSTQLTVEAVKVEPGKIRAWVYGQGTARSVVREFLTFESAGKVVWMRKNPDGTDLKEGDFVKGPAAEGESGELLARQDTRQADAELATAEAAIVETEQQLASANADKQRADAQLRTAQLDFDRKSALRKRQAVSQADLDKAAAVADEASAAVEAARAKILAARASIAAAQARAEQARIALENLHLYAPIDGVVGSINISRGQYWSPNFLNTSSEDAVLQTVPILVIAPDEFEVTVALPSFDGNTVERGQKAFLVTTEAAANAALGGCETCDVASSAVPASVYAVSPTVSPDGRSITVKLRTEPGTTALKDGMYVSAWIIVQEKDNALRLPRNALMFRGNDVFAFVIKSGSTVERRKLQLGIRSIDGVEVLSGISAGEQVVTRGRDRLSTGASVKVVAPAK